MRDIVLTILIFGALPYVLVRPFAGVLLFNWLAYFNPQTHVWSFATRLPFSQLVGGVAIASWLLNPREPKKPPACGATYLWLLLIAWVTFTTVFAIVGIDARIQLEKVLKIQLFALVTVTMLTSSSRVRALLWCIVLSLGFYGVKGGVWVIATGGLTGRVWGPQATFIEDNNALALALLMIVPLMYYLYRTEERKWVKRFLLFSMAMVSFSIAGSFSRGAILGAIAMAIFLVRRSRQKLTVALAAIALGVAILSVMPEEWFQRADTITEYQAEGSAQKRLNTWTFAWRFALDHPVVGGGFEVFQSPDMYVRYAPRFDEGWIGQDAHSIYFEVLAEHGFVGLMLFVCFYVAAWRRAGRVIEWAKGFDPVSDQGRAGVLAGMLQASLVAYAVGGAFQGLSYFDLPFNIAGLAIALSTNVLRSLSGAAATPAVAGPGVQVAHMGRLP